MTKNPFVNSLIAIVYIALVASFMYYTNHILGSTPDSLIMPVSFLCLFVLSAAMMGITFFYQPIKMYLDGDKKNSLALITRTIVIFAAYTIVVIATMFILFSGR